LYSFSKIIGIDSLAIRVKSTGTIQTNAFNFGPSFGQYPLGLNRAIFDSGATYYQSCSINPLSTRNVFESRSLFSSGSNYVYADGFPSFDGKTLGNLICLKNEAFSMAYPGFNNTAPLTVENLQIDSGVFNFGIGTSITIKGNILVNAAGTLSMNPAAGVTPTCFFKGNKQQRISGSGIIDINTTATVPMRFVLNNPAGLRLNRNLSIGKGALLLDTGALNLNGNTLTIGQDSINYGFLKANKGYITGNGVLSKWYAANKTVNNNRDSCIFPFGTDSSNRTLWLTGNVTAGGLVSIRNNNIAGLSPIQPAFTDSAATATINTRHNYNWQVNTSMGLAGNNFTLSTLGAVDNRLANMPSSVRLTLANGKAPGNALVGTGTALLPSASRNNLTINQLNNTFYMGGFSNICFPPPMPISNNAIVCQGAKASLSSIGIGNLSWYSDSVGGNLLKLGASYTTPNLQNTQNYYVQDSTCTVGKRKQVSVWVVKKGVIGFSINNKTQCFKNNQFIFTDTNTSSYATRIWSLGNNDTNTSAIVSKKFIAPNTYTISLIRADSNTCTDTASVAITVNAMPSVATTLNKYTLTATQNNATYQWLNCNSNYAMVANASNKSYTATVNGNYAVAVNLNNCIDTSTCTEIKGIGIAEAEKQHAISIYPNPSNGLFTLQTSLKGHCTISNELGQTIQQFDLLANTTHLIDLSAVSNGMYFIQFISNNKLFTYKLVKQ
jgi:hypothetical protein